MNSDNKGKNAMKKRVTFLVLTGLAISVAGCGIMANRHIGKTFDYTWANACTWDNLPASCSIPLKHFTFNFDVEQLLNGEYTINGHAFVNERARLLTSFNRATFTFLLGKEGTIHDAVYYYAHVGDLWSKILLKARFTSESDFDALFVNYEVVYPSPFSDDLWGDSYYERRLEPRL
jgi:hypothetical protein